jgi:hypothetical protein
MDILISLSSNDHRLAMQGRCCLSGPAVSAARPLHHVVFRLRKQATPLAAQEEDRSDMECASHHNELKLAQARRRINALRRRGRKGLDCFVAEFIIGPA